MWKAGKYVKSCEICRVFVCFYRVKLQKVAKYAGFLYDFFVVKLRKLMKYAKSCEICRVFV